jgi:hypothetical protein
MNDSHATPPVPCGTALIDALPRRQVSQEVLVRGALSRRPEARSAVQVFEWMVEPVAGTTELSLTLVLSENLSLCFLLAGEDARDLGVSLAPPEQNADAP